MFLSLFQQGTDGWWMYGGGEGREKARAAKTKVGAGSNEVMECEIGIDYIKIGVDVCPTYPVIIKRREKSCDEGGSRERLSLTAVEN